MQNRIRQELVSKPLLGRLDSLASYTTTCASKRNVKTEKATDTFLFALGSKLTHFRGTKGEATTFCNVLSGKQGVKKRKG